MKKTLLTLVLISSFSFSYNIKDELLKGVNDYKVKLQIEKDISQIEKELKYVVKTTNNLAPKFLKNAIFLGDDKVSNSEKFEKFLLTYFANEEANFYVYDDIESIEYYKYKLSLRKITSNNIHYIDSKTVDRTEFMLKVIDQIISNESENDILLNKRIAIICNAFETKGLLYVLKDYVKRNNSKLIIDEFSYIQTKSRKDIDELNEENISILRNILSNYFEYINKH